MSDVRPIGIFDSGLGGLTIARKLADTLPHESFIYVGDTLRCPYGARTQGEVQSFALQIGRWLESNDIKLLVIACNTATAAALSELQKQLSVPVIGVVKPGARAGVASTKTKRIGVLATAATVASNAYLQAIHELDPTVDVFQASSPAAVQFVESQMTKASLQGTKWLEQIDEDLMVKARCVVQKDCVALLGEDIDTVILGCTHFPLLKPAFQKVFGEGTTLVSSAEETEKDVRSFLTQNNLCAPSTQVPHYQFITTAQNTNVFERGGSYIFGCPLDEVRHVGLEELESIV